MAWISAPKKKSFLEALRENVGNISKACKVAGVDRSAIYKAREEDPKFDQAWADILAEGIDEIEQAAKARAMKMSDTLAIFMLKCHRPERYRDQANDQGGTVKIVVESSNPDDADIFDQTVKDED